MQNTVSREAQSTSNWYFSDDKVSSLHVTETTPVPVYGTTSANSVSSFPLNCDVKLSTPTCVCVRVCCVVVLCVSVFVRMRGVCACVVCACVLCACVCVVCMCMCMYMCVCVCVCVGVCGCDMHGWCI